mmetsp:Transcript_344/g.919  ORF Transcript_344/g.919 Transcript_344/m.919 type:complete len:210 (+) Transcript_344:1125-1754(+)
MTRTRLDHDARVHQNPLREREHHHRMNPRKCSRRKKPTLKVGATKLMRVSVPPRQGSTSCSSCARWSYRRISPCMRRYPCIVGCEKHEFPDGQPQTRTCGPVMVVRMRPPSRRHGCREQPTWKSTRMRCQVYFEWQPKLRSSFQKIAKTARERALPLCQTRQWRRCGRSPPRLRRAKRAKASRQCLKPTLTPLPHRRRQTLVLHPPKPT